MPSPTTRPPASVAGPGPARSPCTPARTASPATPTARRWSPPEARRPDLWAPEHALRASAPTDLRSEEHTSELQSLMRISYAVFCLKKKNKTHQPHILKQLATKL